MNEGSCGTQACEKKLPPGISPLCGPVRSRGLRRRRPGRAPARDRFAPTEMSVCPWRRSSRRACETKRNRSGVSPALTGPSRSHRQKSAAPANLDEAREFQNAPWGGPGIAPVTRGAESGPRTMLTYATCCPFPSCHYRSLPQARKLAGIRSIVRKSAPPPPAPRAPVTPPALPTVQGGGRERDQSAALRGTTARSASRSTFDAFALSRKRAWLDGCPPKGRHSRCFHKSNILRPVLTTGQKHDQSEF